MKNYHYISIAILFILGCNGRSSVETAADNSGEVRDSAVELKPRNLEGDVIQELFPEEMKDYSLGMKLRRYKSLNRKTNPTKTIHMAGLEFKYTGFFMNDSLAKIRFEHEYRVIRKHDDYKKYRINAEGRHVREEIVLRDAELWDKVMTHIEKRYGYADIYNYYEGLRYRTSRDSAYYATWNLGDCILTVNGHGWEPDYFPQDENGNNYMDNSLYIEIADTTLYNKYRKQMFDIIERDDDDEMERFDRRTIF